MRTKTPASKHDPIQIHITDDQIAYLLCSAREGGSNYWCAWLRCPYTVKDGTSSLLPLRLPASIEDMEDNDKKYTLDREAINRGISLLSTNKEGKYLLGEILNDNTDAGSGDVFLQLCIFGEVKYG